ncbi:MAG TPA: hypothetical protein PLD55_13220 [bacterium]|jgi:hypothetical protein|nr:hypothetical protein [bacterium]HNW15902.1 hypothetical protein [bacterium]HNZ53162.1 hypothetical protein [bacterium]HOG43401.1 hypothetical protein [bacterium]HPY13835.1 hypothetical protein [bacterium]
MKIINKCKLLTVFLFVGFFCSGLYAEDFKKHTLGFSVESGVSRSFLNSYASNGKAWHDIYGTFGGTFFYQYRFTKVVAVRPGLGIYSYFFGVPGPMDDLKDEVFATIHGRIDLSLALYTYTGNKVAFPFLITPFISMRFYDSAGTYETYFEGEKEVMHNFRTFIGGQISFGIESSNPEKTGAGFHIFMRMNDVMGTGGQSGVPCSLGGSLMLFW